jgi:hypothetical protein
MTVGRPASSPWGRFRWPDAAAIWAREATPLGLQMLRAHTPVGRGPTAGRLRQSVSDRPEPGPDSYMITFYTTVPYAKFVIGGTRPHTITVRNARVLAWTDAVGNVSFARRVNHPGNKPNPFPGQAMALIGPAVSRIFAEACKEAMKL